MGLPQIITLVVLAAALGLSAWAWHLDTKPNLLKPRPAAIVQILTTLAWAGLLTWGGFFHG